MIFFLEYTQKCDEFEKKVLADPSLTDTFSKVAYVKVTYRKDSVEAKKWKVSSTPTILIVDATKDPAAEIKRLCFCCPFQGMALTLSLKKSQHNTLPECSQKATLHR